MESFLNCRYVKSVNSDDVRENQTIEVTIFAVVILAELEVQHSVPLLPLLDRPLRLAERR
jgi:hypothetical protein